jgi:hypothetical protein
MTFVGMAFYKKGSVSPCSRMLCTSTTWQFNEASKVREINHIESHAKILRSGFWFLLCHLNSYFVTQINLNLITNFKNKYDSFFI